MSGFFRKRVPRELQFVESSTSYNVDIAQAPTRQYVSVVPPTNLRGPAPSSGSMGPSVEGGEAGVGGNPLLLNSPPHLADSDSVLIVGGRCGKLRLWVVVLIFILFVMGAMLACALPLVILAQRTAHRRGVDQITIISQSIAAQTAGRLNTMSNQLRYFLLGFRSPAQSDPASTDFSEFSDLWARRHWVSANSEAHNMNSGICSVNHGFLIAMGTEGQWFINNCTEEQGPCTRSISGSPLTPYGTLEDYYKHQPRPPVMTTVAPKTRPWMQRCMNEATKPASSINPERINWDLQVSISGGIFLQVRAPLYNQTAGMTGCAFLLESEHNRGPWLKAAVEKFDLVEMLYIVDAASGRIFASSIGNVMEPCEISQELGCETGWRAISPAEHPDRRIRETAKYVQAGQQFLTAQEVKIEHDKYFFTSDRIVDSYGLDLYVVAIFADRTIYKTLKSSINLTYLLFSCVALVVLVAGVVFARGLSSHISRVTQHLRQLRRMLEDLDPIDPAELFSTEHRQLALKELRDLVNCCMEVGAAVYRQAAAHHERYMSVQARFVRTLSHEIRTPLTGIVLALARVRSAPDDAHVVTIQEFIASAECSANTLLALLNNVLDYNKSRADVLTLNKHVFDVFSVANRAVQMLTISAIDKGLELWCVTDTVSNRPPLLRGDESRTLQVLINIIGNAIKYTKVGGVFVHVGVEEKDDQRSVVVRVQDTGIGIPSSKLSGLFTEFHRLHDEERLHAPGTGLGLTISKHLVELMQGSIDVTSISPDDVLLTAQRKPEEFGTTFTVSLPLFEPQGPDDVAASEWTYLSQCRSVWMNTPRPLFVCVVVVTEQAARFFREVLGQFGVNCHVIVIDGSSPPPELPQPSVWLTNGFPSSCTAPALAPALSPPSFAQSLSQQPMPNSHSQQQTPFSRPAPRSPVSISVGSDSDVWPRCHTAPDVRGGVLSSSTLHSASRKPSSVLIMDVRLIPIVQHSPMLMHYQRVVHLASFRQDLPPQSDAQILRPLSQEALCKELGIAIANQQSGQRTSGTASSLFGCSIEILLVDDNHTNRRLLAHALEAMQHTVVCAGNGEEAVKASMARVFDLILMDIMMPVIDGIQATRMIRAEPENPNKTTPIVALSAEFSQDVCAEAAAAGMDDYLPKPFTRTAIIDIITRHVHQMGRTRHAISMDSVQVDGRGARSSSVGGSERGSDMGLGQRYGSGLGPIALANRPAIARAAALRVDAPSDGGTNDSRA